MEYKFGLFFKKPKQNKQQHCTNVLKLKPTESKLKTTKLFLAWLENLIKSLNHGATDLGCCEN